MASYSRQRWLSNDLSGLPRKDRRSCDYHVYHPDPISNREFAFEGRTAADFDDAAREIAALDRYAITLTNTEALARLLLRAESVASSKIEGLEVSARRLLRFEAGQRTRDVTAADVLANIAAMDFAIASVDATPDITIAMLLEVHDRLLAPTPIRAYGGQIRETQNWIGGSSYNPCGAAFVPPPPELVRELLEDLCAFCNADDLPVVAQAAIAHAQFETIHPFVDGNGRVGRALIHMIFRRRRLTTRVTPPVSLVLATRSRDYIGGLAATRYEGDETSPEAFVGINQWTATFAGACRQAVSDAERFETTIHTIASRWRDRLHVRKRSAVDLLIDVLPGKPVLTVREASQSIGRSFQQTNAAVDRLVNAGILRPLREQNRNRAFEAPAIISAFTTFERSLATPGGDTRLANPVRSVPYPEPK